MRLTLLLLLRILVSKQGVLPDRTLLKLQFFVVNRQRTLVLNHNLTLKTRFIPVATQDRDRMIGGISPREACRMSTLPFSL